MERVVKWLIQKFLVCCLWGVFCGYFAGLIGIPSSACPFIGFGCGAWALLVWGAR